MKNQIKTLARFNNLQQAMRFQEHCEKAATIILGDDECFWVVNLANMEKAIEGGYELADCLSKESKENEDLPDDLNPDFIFEMTGHSLLMDIVNGKIDLMQLARNQMANRGLGKNGEWIGFEAAAKLWKTSK